MPTPTPEQVRSLPAPFEQTVTDDFIDENGHMNISHYFRLGSWAAWLRMRDLGMGDDYIAERDMSFFTVEHRLAYLGELRLDDPFAVHVGLAGRTSKAVHAVSHVVDRARDTIACTMEIVYVHVSMQTRRALAIPDDLAAAIDADVAAHPWVAETATGLSLRR